jgi:hypothetical protein
MKAPESDVRNERTSELFSEFIRKKSWHKEVSSEGVKLCAREKVLP